MNVSNHTSSVLVVIALLWMSIFNTMCPHIAATSMHETHQAHIGMDDQFIKEAGAKMNDLFDAAKASIEEDMASVMSAFSNQLFFVKKKVLNDAQTLLKKNICSSFLPSEGSTQCMKDEMLELEAQEGQKKTGKPVSMRQEPWFWADATRMSKLARYAYTEFSEMNREDVQVKQTWHGNVYDADAFLVIRKTRNIPGFDASTHKAYDATSRDKVWTKYHEEENLKWQSLESDGPPASVEVVVRGTASELDGIMDLYAIKTEFKVHLASNPKQMVYLGQVHSGFHKQYEELSGLVRDALLPFLPAIRSGKTLLYFSGHSLGGAVAQLLAMDIVTHFELKPIPYPRTEYNKDIASPTISAARVYTFGAPRVGTEKFANHLKAQLFHVRFKFMADLVPEVPLNTMSFKHGDTYAIGLSVIGDLGRVGSSYPGYYAFCVKECSPFSSTVKQVLGFHASDWSYQESIEELFRTERDRGYDGSSRRAFAIEANNALTHLLELTLLNEMYDNSVLAALRCMGDELCLMQMEYPGATHSNFDHCQEELRSKGIDYNIYQFMRMIGFFGSDEKVVPKDDQIAKATEAFEYRNVYKSALATCMKPFVDETLLDNVAPRDFVLLRGNVEALIRKAQNEKWKDSHQVSQE